MSGTKQRKNTQNRRMERVRAFQVIYSLFFSPADSVQALGRHYTHTFYVEPLSDAVQIFASEYLLENEHDRPSALTLDYPRDNLDGVCILTPDAAEIPGGFAWELVVGVWQKQSELDGLITDFSQNWRIDRMGKAELALLRLSFCELAFRDDTPPKVVINEAIELSKLFGDDNSRGFVNGILDAAVKAVESGVIKRASVFWGK